MIDMNKVILIGRIGTEPKSKPNYCQIRLAVDNKFRKKNGEMSQHTEWFNVVGFQDTGNNMTHTLGLGDLVKFEGSLQSSKYVDSSGTKRTSWSVIVQNFERVSQAKEEKEFQHLRIEDGNIYTRIRD